MSRFYFNIIDALGFIKDEEGLELSDLRATQVEATASLVNMVKDMSAGESPHDITVCVREDCDIPVMVAELKFKMRRTVQ